MASMTELASAGQLRASLARWVLVLVPGLNLLGFLSARASLSTADNPWFISLTKPALYPAPIVFPIVWTTLYVLMGLALAIVVSARAAPGRGLAIGAFAVHMVANLVWSPMFFGAHMILGALIDAVIMAVTLVAVIALYSRVRPLAAALLVPYLAWVLFAIVLNWQILQLNPDAQVQPAPPVAHIQL
jgi:benzodiazapine receptor